MNRTSEPAATDSLSLEGDLGPACRSWRIGRESDATGKSLPDSLPASLAGTSRPESASQRWAIRPLVDVFTEAWEQGKVPVVEDYLDRLSPADSLEAVELIYREYCLAEADGQCPDPSLYLARFPRHRESLERLLRLHGACSTSMLGRWVGPASSGLGLPQAGDSIGPYVLRRELGRGGFARVFLAEQADLENRLVVVKVSTQVTREPWLLARARHAHIVEIMSHTEVDDGAFQLICMPFFGGATLAAVLAERREQARSATSGRDLLADLDGVAAPEYPVAHAARPARELMARLSYDRAIAWIVARLAEALDHAYSRDVSHGDVKPSNILLSADGNPMLLDFNLARDGTRCASDPGGTLAYMAPERLRALADEQGFLDADSEPTGNEQSPHLADLYALGMVLLEALTGRSPLIANAPDRQGPAAGRLRMRAMAGIYATARARSAGSLVRDSELAGGRPVAPGLRAILGRCLDPDPAGRYGRAAELANDLDRWRTDRPLAFADEPFWGQTVPRWLRRNRRTLMIAAVCLLTTGLLTRVIALNGSILTLYQNALGKLARMWDDPKSEAYRYQPAQTLRLLKPDEPWVIEAARRVLHDYGILGSGDVFQAGSNAWRQRDDVRRLPASQREDLELWIMERIYRYCRALEARDHAPGDWEQALKILDEAGGPELTPAFEPLRARLLAKLGAVSAPVAFRSAPGPAFSWQDEHLLGFVAECEEPEAAAKPSPTETDNVLEDLKAEALKQRGAAERALGHYAASLAVRPDSYWGHRRAAGMCYGLGRLPEAAGHLERCLQRRPENPVLLGQLAGCLFALKRYPEARLLCDQALERAPDQAEFYRTRAFIRTKMGDTEGLADDLRQFQSRRHPGDLPDSPIFRDPVALTELPIEFWPAPFGGREEVGEIVPEEVENRLRLADAIRDAGEFAVAQAELDKILRRNPDDIRTRMKRAEYAIKDREFDVARRELDAVLNHTELLDQLRQTPINRLTPFFVVTNRYLREEKKDEAEKVARIASDLADRIGQDVAKARYNLAQVFAVKGQKDPQFIQPAAEALAQAFAASPHLRQWYREDRWWLYPVRKQLDAALRQIEGPAKAEGRIASASPAPR